MSADNLVEINEAGAGKVTHFVRATTRVGIREGSADVEQYQIRRRKLG